MLLKPPFIYVLFYFLSFQAHVELRDLNDSPPRFTQNYYVADVDEDVRSEFPILKIAVYDDDSLGGLQLSLDTNEDLKIRQDGESLSPV